MTTRSSEGTHRSDLLMYVLGALCNDMEQLEVILELLNSDPAGGFGWTDKWGREFQRDEVIDALKLLAKGRLVDVFEDVEGRSRLRRLHQPNLDELDFASLWFGMTDIGRELHERWVEQDH